MINDDIRRTDKNKKDRRDAAAYSLFAAPGEAARQRKAISVRGRKYSPR